MLRSIPRPWLLVGSLFVVVAFIALGYICFNFAVAAWTFDYFSNAANTISENVTVSGVTYHVENGVVTEQSGAVPTHAEQLAALRLAYAVTLARRDPILDLSGSSKSGYLARAAGDLATEQEALVAAQATAADKQLVEHLYPLSFLNNLARLENDRQTFLSSGKDTDEAAYEQQLATTIAAGYSDANAFKNAYDQTSRPSYTVIAGVVQSSAIDQELESISKGFLHIQTEAEDRSACIAGNVFKCNSSDIKLALPEATAQPASSTIPVLVQQVAQIYNETSLAQPNEQLVKLNSSACIANLGAVPYFELEEVGFPSKFSFVGDIYFTKVGSAYASGLFNNLGVNYLFYDPITYYTCLENGLTFSEAWASVQTEQTLDGASSTPALITQSGELANLDSAMVQASPEQLQALLPLYLMFKDNSAGFPSVVENIAQSDQIDLAQKAAGIPVDLDPDFLFGAKSGFYDLFLAYNPSAGSQPVDLYTNAAANPTIALLTRWSQLSATVSVQNIISDINAYAAYHVNPQSVAYALPTSTPSVVSPASTVQSVPVASTSAAATTTAPLDPWAKLPLDAYARPDSNPLIDALPAFPASAQETTLPHQLVPVSGSPLVTQTYESDLYNVSFIYPGDMTLTEDQGSNDSTVLVLRSSQGGFQIYITPYNGTQITQQRFQEDEPSGVMNDPVNLTIDGIAATKFYSTNIAMGNSVEVWFLNQGFLYEVTAPQASENAVLQILGTWKFN